MTPKDKRLIIPVKSVGVKVLLLLRTSDNGFC